MNLGKEPKTPKELIKHYMLSRHIETFKELSEQSGVPLSTLRKRFKDPRSFIIREIDHICDTLGMSPEDRIFMKGEKRA
nr:MAG TPA: Regulatory protein [Caudoviricetes sp.]